MFGEGVAKINGSDDLKVTNPSGTTVRVAKGGVFVKGTDVTDQGVYFGFNDANYDIVLTAPGSNSRIDAIVARMKDNTDGTTAGDTWTIEAVAGTADPSPVAPAIPTSSYRLANVTITSAGGITIADTRASSALLLAASSGAGVPAHGSASHTANAVRVWRTTTAGPVASHASNFTAIAWDSETGGNSTGYDSDGFHSTSSNTERLTVPTGFGGKYKISGQILALQNGNNGTFLLMIRKNGSINLGINNIYMNPSTTNRYLQVNCDAPLAAGDYVELCVRQDTGANMSFGGGESESHFEMHLIGA